MYVYACFFACTIRFDINTLNTEVLNERKDGECEKRESSIVFEDGEHKIRYTDERSAILMYAQS